MPQSVLLKAGGLYTFPNQLGAVPPGALTKAINVVINRDGVLELRRGFKIYGNAMDSVSTVTAHQLLTYKGRVLRHFGSGAGNTLQFDDGSGTFTSFSGTYAETETGLRIKGLEANSNFYFTTSEGIKKISAANAAGLASATITDAGGIKALDTEVSINYSTGWFIQDSVVAYRVVWGIEDSNDNLILGTPSSRTVIYNTITDLLIRDFNRLLYSLDAAANADGADRLGNNDYLETLKLPLDATAVDIFDALGDLVTKLDLDINDGSNKYAALTVPASPDNGTTAELEALQDYYNDIVGTLLTEILANIASAAQTAGNFQLATQSSTTDVQFTIPEGVTTAHFFQIYRTALTTSTGATVLSDLDPGDEQALVYEANPTSTDISNGYVIVNDVVPEAFRGADLYTNPNTGEGIINANEVPPLAKDIATFKGYTFYANTETKHRKNLNLLSTSTLSNTVSKLTITDGVTTNTYTFVTETAEVTQFIFANESSGNYTGKYFTINSAYDANEYYVWFKVSGSGSDPAVSGKTGIEVDFNTGATGSTIADAVYAKLNRLNDFIINNPPSSTLTVTNSEAGPATNATSGTLGNSVVAITVTTPGVGNDVTNKKIAFSTSTDLSPSQQVDECARNIVNVINKQANESVYAYYLSGAEDVPGLILFESRALGTDTFYLLTDSSTTGSSFSPDLSPTNSITNISVANPTVVTSSSHGLSTGDQIVITNSNSTPSIDGLYTVTVTGSSTFTIPVNVTVLGTTGAWIIATDAAFSSNEVIANRIYHSKFQQPEAVPLTNYDDVGAKDKAIKRIIALRDSLFIFKEEGIYRLSGNVAPFNIALFDSSTLINAPDSGSVLNNLIYLSSTQGIATVSDTGVSIISRPIEDKLNKLPIYTGFSTASHGAGYESDRSYYFWTVSNSADTVATYCYKYNTFTNSWTEIDEGKRSAVVNPADDKLYLGPTDTNYLEQERKSFTRIDYADREYTFTLSGVNEDVVALNSTVNISIGDVILQTQYLTIKQYNRLLKKLDTDSGVTDTDYYSTLGAEAGSNLRTLLTSLATKLDSDTGVTDTNYASTISAYTTSFADTQLAFNAIVNKLNLDATVTFTDYQTSTGTIDQETVIIDLDSNDNTVTTLSNYPFIIGPVTTYEHISATVQWSPQTLTDTSLLKQVSEGTAIFESDNFTSAVLSYSSDLSAGFEDIEFDGTGNGVYGTGTYGDNTYGGSGSGVPFRTLIPRAKQRCRYIVPKFQHKTARETFLMYGLSLTFNPYSTQAYR